ncbi:hypothetical protein MPSEU_000332000 [Mayamaea pseudoterrestris]|nr:hypothetical protein MPSEU_000332000 [Mayamaea pseudoterrestris]
MVSSPSLAHPSAMERVLFNLHHQLCTQTLRKLSARTRSILEHVLLVLAVCCFGMLLLAHLSFVHRGENGSRSHINSVKSYMKYKIPSTCLTSIPEFARNGVDVTHISVLDDDDDTATQQASFVSKQQKQEDNVTAMNETCNIPKQFAQNMTRSIFSYSFTKGYLLLTPDVCRDRNLTVQHVVVAKRDVRCFGEPFLQKIVHRLTSPETVAMNWIIGLMNSDQNQQPFFVYNPRTDTITDLEQQFQFATTGQYYHYYSDYNFYNTKRSLYSSRRSHQTYPFASPPFLWHQPFLSKLAVVIKTSFLFFTTTTLISFTLRETQERMLDFTHSLQAQVRLRQSVWTLVTTHLLQNLVFVPQMIGLCFFLTEFYHGDKFLAFMVLSLVWLCEVFSVISLRSAQGMHYFPRIFFLLFSLFHYYLFSFPFGFSYTALTSTVLFMAHSMLFFFCRYELPAVAHGQVSLSNPRMGNNSNENGNGHHLHQHGPQQSAGLTRLPGPQISLSPRVVQQHQYTIVRQGSQTSSGSRQAGSSVVFHHGSTDEDDRDESYLFFMNGEVVMHRRPLSSTSLRSTVSSIHNEDNFNFSEQQLNRPTDAAGFGEDLGSLESSNSLNDAVETSALQAIMEVSMHVDDDNSNISSNNINTRDIHETPRTENLSSTFVDNDNNRTGTRIPPEFPNADDGDDDWTLQMETDRS